jgi:NAD(P)-dependent dehydrogenase (short-subunit alcohol dehydrogenase family)
MSEKVLQGKVVVVTGAGRGIGKAYALALSAEGASIVVNDVGSMAAGGNRDNTVADGVVDLIRDAGGRAVANHDDVADFSAAARIMQTAVDHFGRLDILIANAGIIRPANLFEASEEDWTSVLAVHANGTFNCLRHAAPVMMRQRSGSIITTGYGAGEGDPGRIGDGRGSFPGLGAYRAAKAAILVLTLNAASELRPYGINVNSVMPSATTTRMQSAFYDSLRARGRAENEVRSDWPEPLPPETVPPLGVFLCTEAGRSITGRSFSVYGNRISVASAPARMTTLEAQAGHWSVAELMGRAPAWLASGA